MAEKQVKQYTSEELCELLGKFPRFGGVDIIFIGSVTADDEETYDFEGKVWLVDGHYLTGEIPIEKNRDISFKVDLNEYVDIYCSNYGENGSDIIELWTQDELNEEEQYAKCESIAFMKSIPIHELENYVKEKEA